MGGFYRISFGPEDPEQDRLEEARRTASLAGLAVSIFLVVIGLFLVRQLHAAAVTQECLLSGARICLTAGE